MKKLRTLTCAVPCLLAFCLFLSGRPAISAGLGSGGRAEELYDLGGSGALTSASGSARSRW